MSANVVAVPSQAQAAAAPANSVVTSPELAALWHESNAATVVGIAAITARLLNQIDGHIAAQPTPLDVTGAVVGVVAKTIQPTLETLSSGLAAAGQRLTAHDQQLGVDAGQITALQQTTARLGSDAQALTSRVSHAEDHLAAHDTQFVAVGGQVAALQQTTAEVGSEAKSLTTRVSHAEELLAALDKRLAVADGRITGLQQSNDVLRTDTQNVSGRLADAEEQLRRLQEHQDVLQRQHRELRDELLTLLEVEFRARHRALAEQHDEFARRLARIEAAQHEKPSGRGEETMASAAAPRPPKPPR